MLMVTWKILLEGVSLLTMTLLSPRCFQPCRYSRVVSRCLKCSLFLLLSTPRYRHTLSSGVECSLFLLLQSTPSLPREVKCTIFLLLSTPRLLSHSLPRQVNYSIFHVPNLVFNTTPSSESLTLITCRCPATVSAGPEAASPRARSVRRTESLRQCGGVTSCGREGR